MDLHHKLRELRVARGMTQETAAEQLGVSSQTVSKWERGLRSPDISLLPRIAVLYDCSLDAMFQMNTVRGIEHQKEFQNKLKSLLEQKDWDGMYRAWLQEIELLPDQYANYLDVMRFVIRQKFFDDEHIAKMLNLAAYVENHCVDIDIRNEMYRILVELCSYSENPSVKEQSMAYYLRIPKLHHSRELFAKCVMEGEEYRRQVKQNIVHMIDLIEGSILQLVPPDMPPAEKIFYYRKAAELYETVLDGQYGGLCDVALLFNYANVAAQLVKMGNTEEAERYMARALEMLERHLSAEARGSHSALVDSIAPPERTPPEKLVVHSLEEMVRNQDLSPFWGEIQDILRRYTAYFSLV